MICHHDDLVLEERDIRLMRAYLLWVDTVRRDRGPYDWEPSEIDIRKSRLFWWIRSGHDPLPAPPPTAFSCPWYEVITEPGNHHCYEIYAFPQDHWGHHNRISICQCLYDVVEKKTDIEYLVAFGPYRFRCFRDIEAHADCLASINKHLPNFREEVISRDGSEVTRGWFITRTPDAETEGGEG